MLQFISSHCVLNTPHTVGKLVLVWVDGKVCEFGGAVVGFLRRCSKEIVAGRCVPHDVKCMLETVAIMEWVVVMVALRLND